MDQDRNSLASYNSSSSDVQHAVIEKQRVFLIAPIRIRSILNLTSDVNFSANELASEDMGTHDSGKKILICGYISNRRQEDLCCIGNLSLLPAAVLK